MILKAGDNHGLVWSTQKREDKDIPGHWSPCRGWQQLPGENARDWELSSHGLEGARVPGPGHGVHGSSPLCSHAGAGA